MIDAAVLTLAATPDYTQVHRCAAVPARAAPVLRALAANGLPAEEFAALAGPLGTTPKDTIYAEGTLKLQHYRPVVDSVYRVPVLMVSSLVNQPYILDLVPG